MCERRDMTATAGALASETTATEVDLIETAYPDGQIIDYTSWDESGYSIAQVVRYAPASEQTRPCPNCDELAVPGEGDEDSLRSCPRCLASCRFPALDPLVYIRTRSGGKPFTVRESQIRPRQEAGRPAGTSR